MIDAIMFLMLKHFICDFPLQAFPWMYKNKGIYGHLGGVVHAGIHGLGTFFVLFHFVGAQAGIFGLIDMVIHYHLDWAKVNLCTQLNLTPVNSEKFWVLLGLDQLLHQTTYIIFLIYIFESPKIY